MPSLHLAIILLTCTSLVSFVHTHQLFPNPIPSQPPRTDISPPPYFKSQEYAVPRCIRPTDLNDPSTFCRNRRYLYFNEARYRQLLGLQSLAEWRHHYGLQALNASADPITDSGEGYLVDVGPPPVRHFSEFGIITSSRHTTLPDQSTPSIFSTDPDSSSVDPLTNNSSNSNSLVSPPRFSTTVRPLITTASTPSTTTTARSTTVPSQAPLQVQLSFQTASPKSYQPTTSSPIHSNITGSAFFNTTTGLDSAGQFQLPQNCSLPGDAQGCTKSRGQTSRVLSQSFPPIASQSNGSTQNSSNASQRQNPHDSSDLQAALGSDGRLSQSGSSRKVAAGVLSPPSQTVGGVLVRAIPGSPDGSSHNGVQLADPVPVPGKRPQRYNLPPQRPRSHSRNASPEHATVSDDPRGSSLTRRRLHGPYAMPPIIRDRRQAPPRAPPEQSLRTMEAYDCSEPQQLQAVQVSHVLDCPIPDEQQAQAAQPTSQRSTKFQILQSTGFYESYAYRVHVRRSEIPLFCAMSSHMAVGIEGLSIGRDLVLSAMQLTDITQSWKYTPSDAPHSFRPLALSLNSTYHISYNSLGDVHADSNNDYNCQGAARWFKAHNQGAAMTHYGWLNYRYEEISVHKVPVAITDTGHVTDLTTNEQLSCTTLKDDRWPTFCQDSEMGAYKIYPPSQCHAQKLRVVSGTVYQFENTTIFTSEDSSMTHFRLSSPLTLCGEIVYGTDYKDIFLLEDPEFANLEIFRQMSPRALDTVSYFNSKIHFAYKESIEYAKSLYLLAQFDACVAQKATQSIKFAHVSAQQSALNEGVTVRLAANVFATPAGEVIYRYVCRPINVTALDTASCFSALPVQLSPSDQNIFDKNNALAPPIPGVERMTKEERQEILDGTIESTKKIRHFMEPLTHRIVTAAAPTPCSPMPALWKNVYGIYIQANPTIKKPENQPANESGYAARKADDPALKHEDYNWSMGGLFNVHETGALSAFLCGTQIMRETIQVIAQLLRSDTRDTDGPVVGISNMFKAAGYSTSVQIFAWFAYTYTTIISALFYGFLTIKTFGWIYGLKTRYDIITEEFPHLPFFSWTTFWYLFYPSLMERDIRRKTARGQASASGGERPKSRFPSVRFWRSRARTGSSGQYRPASLVDDTAEIDPPTYSNALDHPRTMTIRNPRFLSFGHRSATVPGHHRTPPRTDPLPPPPPEAMSQEQGTTRL